MPRITTITKPELFRQIRFEHIRLANLVDMLQVAPGGDPGSDQEINANTVWHYLEHADQIEKWLNRKS